MRLEVNHHFQSHLTGTLVTNLQGFSGNQQVVEVAGNVEKLIKYYQDCFQATEVIRERMPAWEQLEALLRHARQLEDHASLKSQRDAVLTGRIMLDTRAPCLHSSTKSHPH